MKEAEEVIQNFQVLRGKKKKK